MENISMPVTAWNRTGFPFSVFSMAEEPWSFSPMKRQEDTLGIFALVQTAGFYSVLVETVTG